MALKTLKLSKRRALNLILECGIIGTDPHNMCPQWVYTTTNIRTWSNSDTHTACAPSRSHGWPERAWAWEWDSCLTRGVLFICSALLLGLCLKLKKHLTCRRYILRNVTEIFVNLWFRFLIINCLFLNDVTAPGAA